MKKVLFTLATVALVSLTANAAVIATASFEDNSLGALDTQAGGTGWQGTWDAQSASGTASDFTTVVNKNLVYTGSNFTVNGGNQAVQYSNSAGNEIDFAAVRQLSSPVSAGSGSDEVLYYRFIMNYAQNGSLEGGDRCLVSFTQERDKNGNPWWNKLRAGSNLAAGADWLLKTDSQSNTFGPESFSPNSDVHMVVVKLQKHETRTSFSRYTMYLDPTDKNIESGSDTSATIGGYYPTELGWVGLLGRTLDVGDLYYVDDVVVADTWQEAVTGVPEPATLILFGLGAAVLRRKK
jgi:hypothetical protein